MREEASDEALMVEVAAGHSPALRMLMERHMRRAIRLAEGILRSPAEAEDVAQEAFVRVWRQAGSFDAGRGRFQTWLNRIVVNLAIDRIRKPRGEALDAIAEPASSAPDALAELISGEERQAVEAAIAALPERQRAAIALFHFEGLSGREGAAAMSLGEKAFESLLIRARAALKAHVAAALAERRRS
jgi:RNA polymerase sigma-70 factor (ECF subfamily)